MNVTQSSNSSFEDRNKQLQLLNESLEREISERIKAERAIGKLNRELMAISNCNQVLVRAVDEQTLLNDICRIVCVEAGYKLAWVGFAENDAAKSVRPAAWYGYDEGYIANANINWDENSDRGQGSTGKAIRSGRSVFSQNLSNDPIFKPWSEEAMKRGFQSSIALPMKNDAGKVFGALMLYSSEPDFMTPEEIRLLEQLAGDLAFGITSLRLRAEHKKAVDALNVSEAHFHSLFDRVKDGVYRSTHEGKFVDLNPAMVSMFGFSDKEEMMNVDIKRDLYFLPEERDNFASEIGLNKTDIFRMRRKDGSEIWVEENGLYEMDEHGNPLYREGILRDVTERLKAEEDLIQAKEKAEQSDRLKTVFLQNISHEIRTPMNAISGFTKLLNSQDLAPEELNSYAGIVQKNVDQLLTIINDILTISSIETNQEKVDIQPTSVNDIMDELYFQFKEPFSERNCTMNVRKTLENKDSFVHTDNNKLTQILRNLLSNALKFTDSGSVDIGYELRDNVLEFFVKDTGIGIDPNMHELIFDHFRKANNHKFFNLSGTGLGLSISKGFVELLGGQIWVESETGKGAAFYFTIPFQPAH